LEAVIKLFFAGILIRQGTGGRVF